MLIVDRNRLKSKRVIKRILKNDYKIEELSCKSSPEKYSIFAKALSKVLIQNKVIVDKNDRQPIVYKSNKLKKLVKLKETTESPEEPLKIKKLITKEVMLLR